MTTKDPKHVTGGYAEIHKDTLQLLKKGKFTSIPFLLVFVLLFSFIFMLKPQISLYIGDANPLSYTITLIFIALYAVGFLFLACGLQEILNYTYLKKKIKFEDNIDCFFYSFKNYKIILQSIRQESFAILGMLSIFIFFSIILMVFATNTANDPSIPVDYYKTLSPAIQKLKLISDGLSNIFLFYSISTRLIPNLNIISGFMYLNIIRFNLNFEDAKIFTLKGIALNQDLLYKLNRNAIYLLFLQFFIPFSGIISLLLVVYWISFYHSAWQKIYNEQDGVTEKVTEKVENNIFITA